MNVTFAAVAVAVASLTVLSPAARAEHVVPGDGVQRLVRADVGPFGSEADGSIIGRPSLSADGRYVAFASAATNLVAGESGEWIDVFVHDQVTRTTRRVNIAPDGAEANGASFSPAISGDVRYVAYDSYATNLVADGTNGRSHVFVVDLVTGRTRLVSAADSGAPADGDSGFASISGDGRFVAYDSTAGDIAPDDTNAHGDVFVWDRLTGLSVRASVADDGGQADAGSGLPSISWSGRQVAFVSAGTNLVSGDTNDYDDIYVRDLDRATTVRASLDADGAEPQGHAGRPALSAGGGHVAFHVAWPLTPHDTDWALDVYVRDLAAGTTLLASPGGQERAAPDGHGRSYGPSISGDGRYVAFTATGADALPARAGQVGQSVYLRDMRSGDRIDLAVAGAGGPATGGSYAPALTPDARAVAFGSAATGLVPFDTNNLDDVFVRSPLVALPAVAGPEEPR